MIVSTYHFSWDIFHLEDEIGTLKNSSIKNLFSLFLFVEKRGVENIFIESVPRLLVFNLWGTRENGFQTKLMEVKLSTIKSLKSEFRFFEEDSPFRLKKQRNCLIALAKYIQYLMEKEKENEPQIH